MNLKFMAEQAAQSLGAVRLIRYRNQDKSRILMYHRFHGGLSGLSAQCEHLSRHYHSISLTELAASTRDNRPLPPNSLAITVDDGYGDFRNAFPIFQRYGLKVTLYVVSGFASGELWLWPDQLLYLFENTKLRGAEILLPSGPVSLNFTNPFAAFDLFSQLLIKLKNQDRLRIFDSLPALLQTELPPTAPERFAPLSWQDLRDLAGQGLDIGCHTATHPILSRVETGLDDEIAASKTRIEKAVGVPVRHFCYPNGKVSDVGSAATRMAVQTGYQTAVLAESGFAGPPFHLFELKRLAVAPELPLLYFERYVAGYRVQAPSQTGD